MVPKNEQIIRALELNCLKAGTDLRSELKRLLSVLWVNPGWGSALYDCVLTLLETWNFQAANCVNRSNESENKLPCDEVSSPESGEVKDTDLMNRITEAMNKQRPPENQDLEEFWRRSRESARLCLIYELIDSCRQFGIDFNQDAALMNEEYKRVISKSSDLFSGYCAAVLLDLEYGGKVRNFNVSGYVSMLKG